MKSSKWRSWDVEPGLGGRVRFRRGSVGEGVEELGQLGHGLGSSRQSRSWYQETGIAEFGSRVRG